MQTLSTISEICAELDQLIPRLKDKEYFEFIQNTLAHLKSWLEYTRPSITPDKWCVLIDKLGEMRSIAGKDRWVSVNAYTLESDLSTLQYECLLKMRTAKQNGEKDNPTNKG